MDTTLAMALRAEVERRGITQAEAAKEIGVSESVLSRWITQDAIPDPPTFEGLLRFLGLTRPELGDLFLGSAIARYGRRR